MSEAELLRLIAAVEALLIPLSFALARTLTLRQRQRGELEARYQSFLQKKLESDDRLVAELLTLHLERLSREHREILDLLRGEPPLVTPPSDQGNGLER